MAVGGPACCAALETGGGAASDNDDEVAMELGCKRPGLGALKDLKLLARGKIPTHLMCAAAIVGIPDQCPPEVQSFLDPLQRSIEELAMEYEANDPKLFITRQFTDVEENRYCQWVEVHNRREGAPDSPAPKSQP